MIPFAINSLRYVLVTITTRFEVSCSSGAITFANHMFVLIHSNCFFHVDFSSRYRRYNVNS